MFKFQNRQIFALITALLFFVTSCKNDADQKWKEYNKKYSPITQNVILSDFPKPDTIIFRKTGLNFADGIIDMEFVDTSLVLSSRIDSLNLITIGSSSSRVTHKLITRGKDRDQFLNVSDIILTDSDKIFYAFDITLRKFFKMNIEHIYKGNYNPLQVLEFNYKALKGIKSPAVISPDTFAATSYFNSKCRYLIFKSNDSLYKGIGEMPPAVSGWPQNEEGELSDIRSMSYSANLKRKPFTKDIVVAYTTMPRIEIYSKNRLNKVIIGPDNFDPIYKFDKEGSRFFPVEYDKTKFSNVGLKVDSNYIYSLYSGKSNFASSAEKLLIFDWKGKPKKVVSLGFTASNFAIRRLPENKMIMYIIDKNTGDLLKGEI
ncbi:hypothetical protein AY601_1114 [Pedobacter cryoconitis]|uniref:TolB-like protein n=1 Tax=Pedobacter cryoconitis TaxID=188932 RepID=A0A127VA49_9SPHI|nr:BF3164 family lipoprotein [Pedobacter cryoconitis]AMP98041.1 hypothetical protein AY601_1114 [Pedobacter cryoconitis]